MPMQGDYDQNGVVTYAPPVNPQINFKGPYGNMRFKPYEFQEFPKHLALEDGNHVVVNDPEEEAAARADHKVATPTDPMAAERDQLRAALLQAQDRSKRLAEELVEAKANAIVGATTGQPAKVVVSKVEPDAGAAASAPAAGAAAISDPDRQATLTPAFKPLSKA